jgi:hypothetical protein
MRDAPASRRSDHCLNCGTATPDNFCPHCGQHNTHYHVSVWALVAEAAGELFQLDARLTTTLGTLLFRPGKLTAEYVAGRRVRYSPPLRVYLVTSLLYFVTLSVVSALSGGSADPPPGKAEPRATTDAGTSAGATADEKSDSSRSSGLRIDGDSDSVRALNSLVKRRIEAFKAPDSMGAKDRYLQALVEQIPKALFVLLPIFALCLKLVYLRRRRFYSEHLVFALHLHAFVFIALTVAAAIQGIAAIIVALGVGLVYFFVALRRVYGQGRVRTFLKWNIVLFLYFWAMLGALALAAALAFAIG